MSDPVLDIESSEQDASPVELFDIVHGTTTYRLTSATRDIVYGSLLYVATAKSRGEVGVPGSGNTGKEVALTLPIDHALVRRYLKQGVPPLSINCTIRRYYVSENQIEQIWYGPITSMSVDDENSEATFNVASRLAESLLRVIPTLTMSRTCSHMLYDKTCGISRTAIGPDGFPYKQLATATFVDGRTVRFDLSNVTATHTRRATWLTMGELVHVASGERRTIIEQSDPNPGTSTLTQVTMSLLIPELKVGDQIEAYAGCQWDAATCDAKFNNISAHSGCPYAPTGNPLVPGKRTEI